MGKDPNAKSLHDALDAAVMKADRLASQQRESARSSTPTDPSQVLHRRFELAKTTHLIRRIRSLLSRHPFFLPDVEGEAEAEAEAETDLGDIDPSIDADTTDD